MAKKAHVTQTRSADQDHNVLTVEGGSGAYRRKPCPGCPWRVDNTGDFPAEAFVISAPTAYDLADSQFGCHESGKERPATCAGFLLRGVDHNIVVRIKVSMGVIDLDSVSDGGRELHESYRAMAVANGVPPSHPALDDCR